MTTVSGPAQDKVAVFIVLETCVCNTFVKGILIRVSFPMNKLLIRLSFGQLSATLLMLILLSNLKYWLRG